MYAIYDDSVTDPAGLIAFWLLTGLNRKVRGVCFF